MDCDKPPFAPPAFILMRVGESLVVCQSVVKIDYIEPSVEAEVNDLFKNNAVQADICEIPPPTEGDRGVTYLQAKIQAVPVPRPGPGG